MERLRSTLSRVPATDTTDIHVTAAGRLREVEQRYTTGRRALVDVLVDAGRPLTIADVLAEQRHKAQSSVYRNLAVLEQAGVVRRVQANDEFSRFELAEDLTEHHHHLVCEICGSVSDFTLPSDIERTLSDAVSKVQADTGFRSHTHRLDLIGRCATCEAR